jgi:hypothetical protein
MSDRIYHVTRDTLIVLIMCVIGFIAGAVVHAPHADADEPVCSPSGTPRTLTERDFHFEKVIGLFTRSRREVTYQPMICSEGPLWQTEVTATPWTQPRAVIRRECATDEAEGVSCVWDARHLGNGTGSSFALDRDANLREISHRRAHRLLGYSVR